MESYQFYVYCHRRKTDGRCFYIGKGSGKRYKAKESRNPYWWNIVNKHGFESEILINGLTEEKAFELEAELCKQIGYKNLCNVREELGNGGWSHSEETKQQIGNALKGKIQSKETIEKRSKSLLGNKALSSQERSDKISKSLYGNTKRAIKISKSLLGKSKTKEHSLNISKNNKGITRNQKPISQYDLEGNFVKEWSSITEAKKHIKADINAFLLGKQKTAGGFLWRYKF
jgi:hypothetical protein